MSSHRGLWAFVFLIIGLLLNACPSVSPDPDSACLDFHCAVLATEIADVPDALAAQIDSLTDGVHGAGANAGASDGVFSMGYDIGINNYVIVAWPDARVQNGPGADFAIFENAFTIGGTTDRFMDPIVIHLSIDGDIWVPFPHHYTAPDPTVYSRDPQHWTGFAGITPVLLNERDNPVDPFEPHLAGGDHFDLDDLDDDEESRRIRTHGFRFLKMTSAHSIVNPQTGSPFPRDPIADGPDIDGVYARYLIRHEDIRVP